MKFLTVIISLLLGLIVFMPKSNLFFTLQKELQKQNIYINTDVKESVLDLKLNNSVVFINGMDLFSIQQTKCLLYMFYNEIEIKNIKINFDNLKIDKLNINYSLLKPFNVIINGNSNFAQIEGVLDLKKKTLKVYLLHLKNSAIKGFLKKDKKGYFYAQTF